MEQTKTMEERVQEILDKMDKSLLRGYEAKNLGGCWVQKYLDEFRHLSRQVRGLRRRQRWCFALASALLVGFAFFSKREVLLALLGLLPVVMAIAFILQRKERRLTAILSRNHDILDEFLLRVVNLNPPRSRTSDVLRYDERFVQDVLVTLAMVLLESEDKFKVKRMSPEVSTEKVVSSAQDELKRRWDFKMKWEAVERFGLTFDKREIFQIAQARIEMQNAG